MKVLIMTDIDNVYESTLNSIINSENTLMFGHFNENFINLPQMTEDINKNISNIILKKVKNSNVKVVELLRDNGVIFTNKNDFSSVLIIESGLFNKSFIRDFFFNYFKEHGCNNVESSETNDILVNGKKVFGITSSTYDDFNMEVFHIFVTLADNSELMHYLFEEYYGADGYKEPGFINLDREELENAFIEFLNKEIG